VLGDTVGYLVGRRYGHRILTEVGRRIPFLRHRIDEHLEQARTYLRRRGGLAILLGRFTAALRVMVPGLAGMAEMPYPEFLIFNALGGALWATAFVLLGYAAGAAWESVAGWATRIGLALLALVVATLAATRALQILRERGEPVPDRLAWIGPVASLRRRFPGPAAWLARRVDPRPARGFLLSVVMVLGVASSWLAGALTQDVLAHDEAVRDDPGIERLIVEHREAWLTGGMRVVTWLGSNVVLAPLVVLVGVFYVVRRRTWLPGFVLAVSLLGVSWITDGLKVAVGRPRPPEAVRLIAVSSPSFPSGHAAHAAAALCGIAAVLASGRTTGAKVRIWVLAIVLSALVAFSRLYLGVHWFTDLVAGLALGGAWLCLIVVATIAFRAPGETFLGWDSKPPPVT
jgi:membrane-associated phospholipid phosphatase